MEDQKENKKLRFFKIILLLLIIGITVLILRDTYSKYLTNQDASNKYSVLGWNIKINNTVLPSNQVLDFTSSIPIDYEVSNNIADNKLAPTSKGSFDLNIDYAGTEVPFKYEISLTELKDSLSSGSHLETEITTNSINSTTNKTNVSFNLSINYDIDKNRTIVSENGFTENPVEVSIQLNEGNISNIELTDVLPNANYNNSSYNLSNDNILTFTPNWTKWTNNILKDINVEIYYDEEIIFNNVNKPIKSAFIEGNEIIETNYLPDFRIISYSQDNSEPIQITNGQTNISGVIIPELDENGIIVNDNALKNFKVYIEWYDGNDNIFDNKQDVAVAKNYKMNSTDLLPVALPVNIKFTQLILQNNIDEDDESNADQIQVNNYYRTLEQRRKTVLEEIYSVNNTDENETFEENP